MSETLTAGRELDALVANRVFGAFGFENIDVVNGTPDELFAVLPGNRAVNRVPYFSTDIAAAWEVVEKLNGLGRYPDIQYAATEPNGEMQWCVFLVNPADTEVLAETAPLAICLAALQAVAK